MAILHQQRQQRQLKLEGEINEIKGKDNKEKKAETAKKLKEFFADIRLVVNGAGELSDEIITAKIVPVENLQASEEEDEINGTDKKKKKSEKTKTSIDFKLQTDKYNYDVYALYHDIKLATVSRLIKYPIGSEKYVSIHNFFKFVSDCIFREAVRLGFLAQYEESKADDETKSSNDEYVTEERDRFESDVFNGFKRIYSDVTEFYGEAYYVMSQNGPVFSSLTGKASIDPRETITKGLFNTMKVLPPTKGQAGPYHLMFVSPLVAARIPHPSVPPTELLQFYVHPTETPLPSTRWLKYDSYSSFAPTSDDFGTVLKKGSSTSVWLDKVGLPLAEEEAAKREQDEYENESEEEESEESGESGEESVEEEDEEEEEEDDEQEEEEDVEMKDEPVEDTTDVKAEDTPETNNDTDSAAKSATPSNGETAAAIAAAAVGRPIELPTPPVANEDDGINLLRVLEWSPESFIDDDEIEAATNGREEELVSWLLLELQDLQRTRLSQEDNSAFNIPEKERRLALKIQNILARLVEDTTPRELDLSISHQLPILQTNYTGTLSGPPEAKPAPARSTTRTPSRQTRKK